LSKRELEKFALAQPILDSESFDPTELFRVISHEDNIEAQGMRADLCIQRADRYPGFFQIGPEGP
jgi:hypothetical protein